MQIRSNAELRRDWQVALEQAQGLKLSTVVAKLAALRDFEAFTEGRSFLKLRRADVISFKEHLLTTPSAVTGERLASSTIVHTLDHCRGFFRWLANRKEGRHLDRETVECLTASRADKERARAVPPKPVPGKEEVEAAFAAMPAETLHQRRDRAVFAMLLLAIVRANALASLTLGSVNLEDNSVWQDSRIVRTKNSKSFIAFLFPFFPEARVVLEAWVIELRALGLSSSDALFPRDTELERIETGEHPGPGEYPVWQGSSQVRAIIRNAFKAAGLPAHSPHVFRHLLTRIGLSQARSISEAVAISINLGHSRLETTLMPYGRPDDETRGRLIAGLGKHADLPANFDMDALIKRMFEENPQAAAEILSALARR
ncbi:MAG: tyrosine-type recombinase/integrase [Beijerinckiaceae bacterium]|nr:tyrosine-type recombinase/integrase [Beijerinckiaceae bacterium]